MRNVMRPVGAAKIGFWLVVTGSVIAGGFGSSAVTLSACGESGGCTKLRNDLYATKQIWSACDPDDGVYACIKVGGNQKDCTGVLSCDFAVNPRHRMDAEQAVLTVGQQSQGCYLCAQPNCISGDIAYCEPITRQCLIATELTDAGPEFGGDIEAAPPPVTTTPPDDTGVPEAGAPDAAATVTLPL
jgi:hypothetical protein